MKHGSNRCNQRGMIALILVIWTTIGLSSLLYSLTLSYEAVLLKVKEVQRRNQARSSALLCKDIVVWRLADDARYVPDTGLVIDVSKLLGGSLASKAVPTFITLGDLRCTVTDFISTPLNAYGLVDGNGIPTGVLYAEKKEFVVTGLLDYRDYNGSTYSTSTLSNSFKITLQVNGFPKNNIELMRIQEVGEKLVK